jgi:hypothetical protein
MPTPPPIPQHTLDAVYRLDLDVTTTHPQAQLIVLPDNKAATLTGALRRVTPLPEGFREVDVRWQWKPSAGEAIPFLHDPAATAAARTADPDLADAARATFYPPAVSGRVTIEASAEVTLERSLPGGRAQTARTSQQARIQVLAPVASAAALVNGMIDGYPVGQYLDPLAADVHQDYEVNVDWHRKYPERYGVPEFFYKVDAESKELLIAPNTPLGMFVIDFPWKSLGMPQYIALDMNLVNKLEALIVMMRADGFKISRFVPVYGFRPPEFNLGTIKSQAATNLKEPFSMHQYGRALDLIVDENGDNQLDDLNGDGVVDVHDAAVIMHYVNELDRRYRAEGRMEMVGGAGLYTHNDFVERNEYLKNQTPYIHIDTRGFVRDNGTLVRWPDAWPDKKPILWGHIDKTGREAAPAQPTPSAGENKKEPPRPHRRPGSPVLPGDEPESAAPPVDE